MLKICLLIAFIGHLLCWYCDCRITYTPDGRFSAKMLEDNTRLSELMKRMPLKRPMISIVLGIFALIMSFCGFLSLCEWMRQFSGVYAALMLAGAVAFTTCVIPHHVICGLGEWFYIRLGRTDDARKAVLDSIQQDIPADCSEEELKNYCKDLLASFESETDPKTPYIGIGLWWLRDTLRSLQKHGTEVSET